MENIDDKVDAEVELELLRHEVSLEHLLWNQLVPGVEELILGIRLMIGGD